jgi:E1A/CREB-binding protein
MRTFIYHEILISYLDYVRNRGYATAHIWACPPLKGDDYILYAKPEDQKTPKDDRLRQWYIDMLVKCQQRGIVGKMTNMYDLYFSNKEHDATVVPYMDGDYFPAEVENIIKDIEEGKTGKKNSQQGKKKKNDQKQKKTGRGGTRSTGLDEDALKASGILPPGKDQKSLEEGGRDYVMVKLGETIQPMKESFIVAYLAWEGATEDQLVVPKEIEEYRKKHGIVVTKPSKSTQADPSTTGATRLDVTTETSPTLNGYTVIEESTPVEQLNDEKSVDVKTGENAENPADDASKIMIGQEQQEVAVKPDVQVAPDERTGSVSGEVPPANPEDANSMDLDENKGEMTTKDQLDQSKTIVSPVELDEMKNDEPLGTSVQLEVPTSDGPTTVASGAPALAAADTSTSAAPVPSAAPSATAKVVPMEQRAGKFAAMARKRGLDDVDPEAPSSSDKKEQITPEKEDEEAEVPAVYVTDSKGRRVKVIDDDVEEMDCEFLNNRQSFLNLCQGNHYQFDFLRRAKHSSMMVLWHLHNRDAPKFVQQCTTCSREILSGYRFHFPTCTDFDQCQECVQNPNTPRHPHQLKPMPVAGQQAELTESQRKERQRSIQLHMTLLLHAATCNNAKCPSANCTKMKGLLKHGAQCAVKATGGCNVCKRIWALLQIHARQCKEMSCPVPNCMAIRERVRQLKKQQQAMDDRRRQEMNRVYRGAR